MNPLPEEQLNREEQERHYQDSVQVPRSANGEDLAVTPSRRAHDRSELIINTTCMAWRPYENLIDGELDNRTAGKVTGWLRFFRRGKRPLKVRLDLTGDFHEDIRGKVIRLSNSAPSDRNEQLGREGTYMEDMASVQQGTAGDITAGLPLGPWTKGLARKLMAQHALLWKEAGLKGTELRKRWQEVAERFREHIKSGDLFYPYVSYPYVEWYSDVNGRIVLELDPSQVEVVDGDAPIKEKTPRELLVDVSKRADAMAIFLQSFSHSGKPPEMDGDGDGPFSTEA